MGNGLNKGMGTDGRPAADSVKDAKKQFIEDALNTLGMLLDSPTGSGSAGNSGKEYYSSSFGQKITCHFATLAALLLLPILLYSVAKFNNSFRHID